MKSISSLLKLTLQIVIVLLLIVSSNSCKKEKKTYGCKDRTALNYDSQADDGCDNCCTYPKKGALLFYILEPTMIPSCGPMTIRLSNGMQSTITNYYNGVPQTCQNLAGGYFFAEEGNYTYTISPSNPNCNAYFASRGGNITIIGDMCQKQVVQ